MAAAQKAAPLSGIERNEAETRQRAPLRRRRGCTVRHHPEAEMPCNGREGMKGGGRGGHLQSGYFLRDAAASVACPGVLASINGEGERERMQRAGPPNH